MSPRPSPSGVILLCLTLGACSVDETGYGDPTRDNDGLGAPTGDAVDDDGSGAPEVPAPDLVYTARAPLGSEPAPVTVLALPHSFPDLVDPVLRVQGRGAEVPVEVEDGGFSAEVEAARGDVVLLSDEAGLQGRLELVDPLDSVQESDDAGVPGGPPADDVDAGAGGGFDGSGTVQVGAGSLGVAPPYLAWVVGEPLVVKVGPDDTDVVLPADDGDEVCVARLVSGRATTSLCWVLGG
ncbi:MAG: hypothetical protein H6732_04380 [Alphaproteobacteria bacterium]|nr:hypothetical protein [Alphaproteobacteria bacterium]